MKVQSYGKGAAKKEMKNVPSRARKTFVKIALSKAVSFFFLRPALLKLHISAQLVEAFPTA